MTHFVDLLPTVLAAAEEQAPIITGRITGGWSYVWLSYGLTWFTLAAYGLSLWVRRPRQIKDAKS